MLIVTRKVGQVVVLGEDEIRVTLVEILPGGQVRLGIDAPEEVTVHRAEVYQRISTETPSEDASGRTDGH